MPKVAGWQTGAMDGPRLLVTLDDTARRYELRADGELVGYADAVAHGQVVTVPHVETVAPHRGKGYAALLMSGIIDDLRSREQRIDPVCSYARSYVAERPELHDLLPD